MNTKINKNSTIPVYYQIQKHIKSMIENGELQKGDKLPSEREMSKDFDVTRTTVRKAIRNLVTQGYCEKEPGKGLYISSDKIQINIQGFKGFSKFADELNYDYRTEVIKKKVIEPTELIKKKLEIYSDSKVLLLKRVRFINGEPGIVETTHLSLERLPGLDKYNFEQSLYGILEDKYGLEPVIAKGVFNIGTIDEKNAHLLNIPLNSAILKKEAVVYGEMEKPIEYIKAIYRSDKFSFYVESNRIKKNG